MTQIDWNAWLQRDMNYAAKMLLDTGSLAPMYAIHRRDGQLMVVQAAFGSDREKEMTNRAVNLMCIAHDAIGFSFMSEAWMRLMQPRKGESMDAMNKRAYSRKEIITVTLVYREQHDDRKVLANMSEIIRDAQGKIVAVEPMDMPTDAQVTGAVPDILPLEPPSERQRRAAKGTLKTMGIKDG